MRLSRPTRRKTPPPMSDHIAHEEWKRMRWTTTKRQQAPWDLALCAPGADVVVVVVKRQHQNEGPISRDGSGFVLVVCFSAFLRVADLWLCPAPTFSVRYRLLPRAEGVANNNPTGHSALAGCCVAAGVLPTRRLGYRHGIAVPPTSKKVEGCSPGYVAV